MSLFSSGFSSPFSSSGTSRGPQWGEVTAVFGGRFDPPHLGHREAVRGLFQNPGVKQVLIIPSASPPHKPTLASAIHRSAMARINFQSTVQDLYPNEVRIDLRELERERLNPNRASYSFDTLQELRQSERQLAFVIGADQAESLPTWHRFPEILGLCHWIVLERKPDGEGKIHRAFQQWLSSGLIRSCGPRQWRVQKTGSTFIQSVPTDAPAVSSTEIREGIASQGTPPPQSLLSDVIGYLKAERLYGI